MDRVLEKKTWVCAVCYQKFKKIGQVDICSEYNTTSFLTIIGSTSIQQAEKDTNTLESRDIIQNDQGNLHKCMKNRKNLLRKRTRY